MGHILSTPIENKYLERVGNHWLRAGSAEIQGYRVSMEDTHILCTQLHPTKEPHKSMALFAVFDGHSGNAASDYMKDRLTQTIAALSDPMDKQQLTDAVLKLDKEFTRDEDRRTHGCTACFALIQPMPLHQRTATTLPSSPSNASVNTSATTSSSSTDSTASSQVTQSSSSSSSAASTTASGSTPNNKENTRSTENTTTARTHDASELKSLARKSSAIVPRQRFKVLVGNVGDSRAVLIEKDGSVSGVTTDHKPDNPEEAKRINAAGGRVSFSRVDGELAMSRAIGDYNYKLDDGLAAEQQKVIAVPEFLELTADTDDVLLLCCDGLFEKLSNEQVAAFVNLCMSQSKSAATDPAVICSKLVDYSLAKGSKDNMSAMLIQFADGTGYAKAGELIAGPIPEHARDDNKFMETYVYDARRHMPDVTFEQLQLMANTSQSYRDQQLKELDALDDLMIARAKQLKRGAKNSVIADNSDSEDEYT